MDSLWGSQIGQENEEEFWKRRLGLVLFTKMWRSRKSAKNKTKTTQTKYCMRFNYRKCSHGSCAPYLSIILLESFSWNKARREMKGLLQLNIMLYYQICNLISPNTFFSPLISKLAPKAHDLCSPLYFTVGLAKAPI